MKRSLRSRYALTLRFGLLLFLAAVLVPTASSRTANQLAQPTAKAIGSFQCGAPTKKIWIVHKRAAGSNMIVLLQDMPDVDENGKPITVRASLGWFGKYANINEWQIGTAMCRKKSMKVFAKSAGQTSKLALGKAIACTFPQVYRLEQRWTGTSNASMALDLQFASGRSAQSVVGVSLPRKGSTVTFNPRFCKPVPVAVATNPG